MFSAVTGEAELNTQVNNEWKLCRCCQYKAGGCFTTMNIGGNSDYMIQEFVAVLWCELRMQNLWFHFALSNNDPRTLLRFEIFPKYSEADYVACARFALALV